MYIWPTLNKCYFLTYIHKHFVQFFFLVDFVHLFGSWDAFIFTISFWWLYCQLYAFLCLNLFPLLSTLNMAACYDVEVYLESSRTNSFQPLTVAKILILDVRLGSRDASGVSVSRILEGCQISKGTNKRRFWYSTVEILMLCCWDNLRYRGSYSFLKLMGLFSLLSFNLIFIRVLLLDDGLFY